MLHMRSERGSTLILLIGVIATLAILASAIVVLAINVQHNTLKDRNRSLSFNAAEAGLDLGQEALWEKWPTQSEPATALQAAAFGDPYTTGGDYSSFSASVSFFDDLDPAAQLPYDVATGTVAANGFMYVRSTATVNGVTTTVQAEVQRIELPLRIKENTALYTDGEVQINGTGSNNPIGADLPATGATVYTPLPPDVTGQATFPNGNFPAANPQTETPPLTVNDIFPDDILQMLVDEAKQYDQYFTNEAALLATVNGVSKAGLMRAINQQPHLIVIENGDLRLPFSGNVAGSDPLWSQTDPGIIILLGKDGQGTVTFNGHQTIYGIIYAMKVFDGSGTPDIHGLVVAKGGAILKGDRALNYNPDVINNLNKMVAQSVKIVPNTWRELSLSTIAP